MYRRHLPRLTATTLALLIGPVFAQSILRVQASDIGLSCAAIAQEQKALAEIVAAGDPDALRLGQAVAGATANTGGQIAGAAVAQGGGLFGSLLSKVAGAVAQQQVEARLAPDAAAQQRVAEAKARADFLAQLARAKECRDDAPDHTGKTLTPEQFQALAEGPAAGVIRPLTVAAAQTDITERIEPLNATGLLNGDLRVAGKKIYISEFRVMFEVAGKVSASTRAGYMPGGVRYGATHSTIKYQVANLDIPALQAITDRAWADFQARLAEKGVQVEDRDAFVAQHGEVYPATEEASTFNRPVYVEENHGHVQRKFIVMAPTGMKLHPRSWAGMGAGDIGKRIEFGKNKLEGLAIGVVVNIAALESSGSSSSLLSSGSSTAAGEGMTVSAPNGMVVVQGHAEAGMLRMPKGFSVPGSFARFREVGGFDSQKDSLVKSIQIIGALGGVAPNTSKIVEMEIDLDGPAMSRMALQGLATFNQAVVDALRSQL